MEGMVAQVYRARRPRASPLWQCLNRHFDTFQAVYEERYQSRHGFLRPIIPEVVNKFLDCGDLEHGFARIRCDHCKKDHLLAFSCKGRWFCPSCHQKKVQLFGALLTETILFPVPHRHVTLTIPKMLRPYFRYHRDLLKDLCRIAHECVRDVMRTALDQPEGIPGIVMAIHTFGEYLDFHPHLHLLMADGLFLRDERFLICPENGMNAVEELFRARVITFLTGKGLLPPDRARMLKSWRHSGFNIHRSRRIQPDERDDLERVARYIIRNPFSLEKMEFKPPNAVNRDGTVIYRSGMNPKINRNFQIFTPCDFIAAITQHIPDKSFQLVRYYGWYSNKMRGQRKKHAEEEKEAEDLEVGVEVIDVSDHQPRRIPSKKWRDLIKKVWEADPLICPTCQREMRIVSLIDERDVIEKMLKCLGLWQQGVRVDPNSHSGTDPPGGAWVYEPWEQDPFPNYDTDPVLFYAAP
jgi:hypothetical protein